MDSIVTVIVGVVCILIGISNRKGNISLLHSYHREHVPEEDRLPFGKMVGLGMIIIGIGLILMGSFSFAAASLQNGIYSIVGTALFVVSLVVGLGITFYAMKKYNKGIF